MTNQDFLGFADLWQNVHNNMNFGKVFDQKGMEFNFKLLEIYPLQAIEQAVMAYARQNSTAPQPSDIIKLFEIGNGRLSAAEAWAEMPKDDRQCGVISEEMLSAWCVCSDLYENKQWFAAEKAFLSAYERICKENELMRKPVKWSFSHGNDKNNYQSVVERAVSLNRLTSQSAETIMLSAPQPAKANYTALLSGEVENKSDKNKQNWLNVLKALEEDTARQESLIALEKREKLERNNAAIAKATMMLSNEERKKIASMSMFDFEAEEVL